MASAKQIKALLQSHLDGDDAHFCSVAMQMAAHEAKLGHGKLAQELRALIDKAKARKALKSTQHPTPISQPRGELSELLEVTYPKSQMGNMVLDESITSKLRRIIKEHRQFAKIRAHGLSPRRKLLLVGPPGTGKTMTASVLGGELGLPLFQVRLDTLFTKFMGETAAKLRLVFDSIAEVRGIYFFDEFDAIGSQREGGNDVGEIRRVLNSFLKMIEADNSNSTIVAATNHPNILDYALFRRFDDVIEYRLPGPEQIRSLFDNKLAAFDTLDFDWKGIVQAAEGLSNADIVRSTEEAIKSAILSDRKNIPQYDILDALKERKALHAKKAD